MSFNFDERARAARVPHRPLELRNGGAGEGFFQPAKSQLSHCLAERRVGQTILQHTLELEGELLRMAIGRERNDGDDPTARVRVNSGMAKSSQCLKFVSRIKAPFAPTAS